MILCLRALPRSSHENITMFLYIFARILRLLSRKLPLRVSYASANFLAEITYILWRRGRTNLKMNAARILGPQASQRQINYSSRLCMRNYLKYAVDFLRSSLSGPEEIVKRLNIEGAENLDEALKEGKGAVIVSLHFGHWDFGAMEIANRGYPVNVVVDHICQPRVNGFVDRLRSMSGMKVIAARDGITQMLRRLRKNEIVGMLIDKPNNGRGVKIDLCGSPTVVPTGAAVLSLRTGAKIIPCGTVRLPNNTIHVILGKHVSFQRTGNFSHDAQILMQEVWHELEKVIKEYPEQLYVFHRL
ncbi:lysophospholipid acyltransferase family protein [Chloroflexota bacterium]